MDWKQRQAFRRASEAAGADVRRVREDRDDYGARTPDEVRALREQAARSATVCADCFQPLAPDASVTIEGRPVLTGRGTKWWQRVPICLRCWLVNMTPSRRKSWISDQSWFAKSVERCRCEACGRPLRVCATGIAPSVCAATIAAEACSTPAPARVAVFGMNRSTARCAASHSRPSATTR
jgi:hypothetical protein